MTFEEWFRGTVWSHPDEIFRKRMKEAWEARVPEGHVLVSITDLKTIEDAIAFELGGEPCGLHEAHKLIKAMIKAAQESE